MKKGSKSKNKKEEKNNKTAKKETNKEKKIESNKDSILFRDVINVLLKVEKCKGVNSKDAVKEILCDFFINVIENHPKDFTKIYYFLSHKIGPTYLIPDLQVQADIMEDLVIKIFNLSDNSLKDNLRHYGDLGQVASDIKQTNE